jgi:phospholipase/carboxylesterase
VVHKSMDLRLKTYTRPPKSGGKPKQIVLCLHGLGSNGMDLLSLAPYWADQLPDAVFVSPDAPFPCDMAPMGFQWFSLQSRDPHDMLKGIEVAEPILQTYIDQLLEQYGLEDKDLALVGFSQGTMMSLYAGPRRENRIAGILGYSGALLGAESLGGSAIQKPPVCLIHGEHDDVVPIMAYHHAVNTLKKNGFEVSGHTTPYLPHSIDDDGIEAGLSFLMKIFA